MLLSTATYIQIGHKVVLGFLIYSILKISFQVQSEGMIQSMSINHVFNGYGCDYMSVG